MTDLAACYITEMRRSKPYLLHPEQGDLLVCGPEALEEDGTVSKALVVWARQQRVTVYITTEEDGEPWMAPRWVAWIVRRFGR